MHKNVHILFKITINEIFVQSLLILLLKKKILLKLATHRPYGLELPNVCPFTFLFSEGEINTAKGKMNTVKGEMNTVKGEMNTVKSEMNTVKGKVEILGNLFWNQCGN